MMYYGNKFKIFKLAILFTSYSQYIICLPVTLNIHVSSFLIVTVTMVNTSCETAHFFLIRNKNMMMILSFNTV